MSSPFKSTASTSALNRPFKSPLKRALPSSPSPFTEQARNTAPRDLTTDNAKTSQVQQDQTTEPLHSKSHTNSEDEDTPSEDESPAKRRLISHTSETAFRREYVSLQSLVFKTCQRLSTIQQALSIAAHPEKDAELHDLIQKWRGVAQSCADTLYEKVREKVNRMGGVAVFKEREREKAERWKDDFAEREEGESDDDDDEEEMGTEERDERRRRRDEAREFREERIREREEEDGDGEEMGGWVKILENADEKTGFTMKMMLRALGVDAGLIGFEEDGEGVGRWI